MSLLTLSDLVGSSSAGLEAKKKVLALDCLGHFYGFTIQLSHAGTNEASDGV